MHEYFSFKDASGHALVPAPLTPNGTNKDNGRISVGERRRIFKQIIVKCVLQLLLIETTNELLKNDNVYDQIPPEHLLRLMGVLDHSYQFAKAFNEDKELRTALWKVGTLTSVATHCLRLIGCMHPGFMKHLPNLLKQETSSAETLVVVLVRMYDDSRLNHQTLRPQIVEKLLP